MEKQSNDIYQKATHLEETDVTLDFTTKDSGEREHWDSGAQRDTEEGKGCYDLLPPMCIKRVAELYQRGAEKYDPSNWTKGIESRRYLSSMLRHAFQYAEGDREEDHLAAVVFNAFGLMYNEWKSVLCKWPYHNLHVWHKEEGTKEEAGDAFAISSVEELPSGDIRCGAERTGAFEAPSVSFEEGTKPERKHLETFCTDDNFHVGERMRYWKSLYPDYIIGSESDKLPDKRWEHKIYRETP